LELANNKIGNEGASALAEGLQTNTTITVLNLANNKIGNEGASALAQVLQTNTTITVLDLANNQIGNEGAAALAEVLQTNTTITVLNLVGNEDIDPRFNEVVFEHITRNFNNLLRLHGVLEGGQQHIMKTRYGNLCGKIGRSRTHGQHLEEVHGIVALSRANDDNETNFEFVNIGSHLQPDVEWKWDRDNNPFTLLPDHGIPLDTGGIHTFKGPHTFYSP